jgi:hypothetical protein
MKMVIWFPHSRQRSWLTVMPFTSWVMKFSIGNQRTRELLIRDPWGYAASLASNNSFPSSEQAKKISSNRSLTLRSL